MIDIATEGNEITMAKRFDTRTEGLDAYVYMAKTFADTPWLHYGMWLPDERVTVPNLRGAQERYVEKLLTLLPASPAEIFDIGGGTGEMAAVMRDKGYGVEMLTPSSVQIEAARERLGPEVVLHHAPFEEYEGQKKFDALLFSESFQYVPLEHSLGRAKDLLNENGIVVIADCFRKDNFEGGLVPGGGHKFSEFAAVAENYGLEIVTDMDVTEDVAPSMMIDQNFYRGFVSPMVDQLSAGLKQSKPFLHWLAALGFKLFTSKDVRYRLKERLKADYRSPENFKSVNTYRFLVLRPR